MQEKEKVKEESPLFKTKQVKIDTLGEYLQQVRKQLNLDLKTVSILAQIKLENLLSMEAGSYHELPADVYVRGFLKSLANFYHIKEQVLIDQYEKERVTDIQQPGRSLWHWQWRLTPRILVVGGSILVALIAVIYIGIEIK